MHENKSKKMLSCNEADVISHTLSQLQQKQSVDYEIMNSESHLQNIKTHEFPQRVLKTKDICEILQISPTTLWRWRRSGKFPEPVKVEGSSCQFWTPKTMNDWINENINEKTKGE